MSAGAREGAGARIAAGLTASEAVLELTAYALSPAELSRIYAGILEDHPELFYVAPRLSYTYRDSAAGTVVAAVYPTYTLAGAALTEARVFYRETITAILAEMEAVFDGHPHTEAEMVLYLHDTLAARYAYDTRPPTEAGRTAYDLFRDGHGVCQAYAMAALALLRAAGLEADFVASPAMDHAWVHVRADGVWYHVDVTRDDPVASDGQAYVTHTRLLRSDAGLLSLGYHGFACQAGTAGLHASADARYETPSGAAVLAVFEQALTPISVGVGRSLVWVGIDRDGAPRSVTFTPNGITLHAPGDLDGDGKTTPGDVLLAPTDATKEWIRAKLCRPQVQGAVANA